MITLEDAIVRAQLAADDTGMLSQYTYNQICDQLSDAERYVFSLGLVDLGIQTKRGTDESTKIIAKVLNKSLTKPKKDPIVTEVAELFIRR